MGVMLAVTQAVTNPAQNQTKDETEGKSSLVGLDWNLLISRELVRATASDHESCCGKAKARLACAADYDRMTGRFSVGVLHPKSRELLILTMTRDRICEESL